MALLEINGNPVVDPIDVQWDIADLDADTTGRNQEGELFRDRVAVKRQLTCRWGPLREGPMSELLNAVADASFSLTYPDALTGTRRTGTFYVGNRSTPMLQAMDDNTWVWQGLQMSFIEF
jgi:hypothetical protein